MAKRPQHGPVILTVQLSDEELELLERPINGSGGHQSFLKGLATRRDGNIQHLTELDIQRAYYYAFGMGSGGFQQRIAPIALKITEAREESAWEEDAAEEVEDDNE